MKESGNTLAFMLGMRAYTIIPLDRYSILKVQRNDFVDLQYLYNPIQ